jgi:hypothetical protein
MMRVLTMLGAASALLLGTGAAAAQSAGPDDGLPAVFAALEGE